MNDAIDPELERRLAQLRQVAEPKPADKRRVLESVRASALLNAQLPPPHADWPRLERLVDVARPGAASAAKSAARRLYPWLGGALIGGVVGVVLGVGWARTDGSRSELAETIEPAPASKATGVPNEAPIAVEPLPTLAPAVPAPLIRASGNGRAAARLSRQEPPRQPKLDLAGALELLHQAEQALHAGESELALGLLNDLDRRAERASLRQERLTTLVLALCQQRRVEAARATRQELQREFPGSIYTSRLDRSCAREAEPR